MSKTTIPTGGITADAINATLIADDAISEEHIDATVITGSTALAATPADTDELLISDAGTIKRIDYSYLKGELNTPVLKAVLSGGQSISNATQTTMAFATEQVDTDSVYNTSNYRFTPDVEGDYFFVVCGLIEHANAQNEYGDISVFKNGNKVISNRHANATDNNLSSSLMCTGITHMNGSSDYAEASIYHNLGVSRTLDSNEDFTYFIAFRLTGSR